MLLHNAINSNALFLFSYIFIRERVVIVKNATTGHISDGGIPIILSNDTN